MLFTIRDAGYYNADVHFCRTKHLNITRTAATAAFTHDAISSISVLIYSPLISSHAFNVANMPGDDCERHFHFDAAFTCELYRSRLPQNAAERY